MVRAFQEYLTVRFRLLEESVDRDLVSKVARVLYVVPDSFLAVALDSLFRVFLLLVNVVRSTARPLSLLVSFYAFS